MNAAAPGHAFFSSDSRSATIHATAIAAAAAEVVVENGSDSYRGRHVISSRVHRHASASDVNGAQLHVRLGTARPTSTARTDTQATAVVPAMGAFAERHVATVQAIAHAQAAAASAS